MKCTCGADVPPPEDPTARTATCPECGSDIDLLAFAPDATIVASGGDPASAGAAGNGAGGAEVDELLGRILGGGRYRIDSAIGRGGMGTVYLGTQTNLNRRVAIKVLAPDLTRDEHFVQRFQREAGTLAALEHPHITAVYDVGVEEGLHYIVMAYVAGPKGSPTSLRELMAAGPMDEELALRIVGQVSNALHYAHERGIVHRDIKPGNILIDEKGAARIADFGIARAGLGQEKTLTLPGTVIGSLRYMAPEQKLDAARVDARSDLYSLGVMFYEMLVGHVPEGRFALPSEERSEIDERIDTIIDRALQIKPEARFQTALEVERELSTITTERLIQRTQEHVAEAQRQPPVAKAKAKPTKPKPKPKPKPEPPPEKQPVADSGSKNAASPIAAILAKLAAIPGPAKLLLGAAVVGGVLWVSKPDSKSADDTPNRAEPARNGGKGGKDDDTSFLYDQQTLDGFQRKVFRALADRDENLFKELLVSRADRAELWRASRGQITNADLINGRNEELAFFREFVSENKGARMSNGGLAWKPQIMNWHGLPYVQEVGMNMRIRSRDVTLSSEGMFKVSRGWVLTTIVPD